MARVGNDETPVGSRLAPLLEMAPAMIATSRGHRRARSASAPITSGNHPPWVIFSAFAPKKAKSIVRNMPVIV
jgi:hypothetical protein